MATGISAVSPAVTASPFYRAVKTHSFIATVSKVQLFEQPAYRLAVALKNRKHGFVAGENDKVA